MPRKQAEIVINDDDDITDVWTIDSAQEPTLTDAEKKADAIKRALEDDNDAYINVHRQLSGGKSPMEFVGRYAADKYDFGQLQAHLQDTFGGGDYRCMLYSQGKIVANRLITIAESAQRRQLSPVGDMATFMTSVLDRMDRNMRQMVELIQSNNNGTGSRKEMLQEMLIMKQMFGSTNDGANPVKLLRDVVSLQSELGLNQLPGPEKDEESWSELFEHLTPLVEAAAGAPPRSMQQPKKVDKQTARKQQMSRMLKMGIAQLVKGASVGGSFETYAELVLTQVPDKIIRDFIIADDSLSKLAGIDPRVTAYSDWFVILGEHIKAQLGLPSTVSEYYAEMPATDNLTANNDPAIVDAPPPDDAATDDTV